MGVYWLASYPKSGNTWMRVLLSAYLRPDAPPGLDALVVHSDLARRSLVDDLLGVPTADLYPGEFERLHPRACEQLADDVGEEPYVVKVHAALRKGAGGRYAFPPEATAGVVYVVRNPLDVAASLAPFFGWTTRRAVRVLGTPDYVLNADSPTRRGTLIPEPLFTWSGHVESWLDAPGYRVLLVRYEDLLDDTAATFERVVRFVGYEVDGARIEAAVERARFDRLRAEEAQHGFRERPRTASAFFRSGRAGGWREALAPEEAAQVVAQHGTVMRRLGYDALVEEVEARTRPYLSAS